MTALQEQLARLRRFNAWVGRVDKELATEGADRGERGAAGALEAMEIQPSPQQIEQAVALETIVLRRTRPVLAIRENELQLVFEDAADSEIWSARLKRAKPMLDSAVRAVGRIELKGAPLDWVGTGWLVADNIMVTNRHVAQEFAMRRGDGFTFRLGSDGPIGAAIDFLQEIGNPGTLVFRLVKPLYIEEAPGPDVSFFEIEVAAGNARLAAPIALAARLLETENVATIGYPAYDSRIPEPDLMERIYGRIYNKKRLAPGGVTRIEQTRLQHNCTTLGGNSGSIVMDLDTGQALGLHFSGSFLKANYAVRADVVRELLAKVRSGRVRPEAPARKVPPAAPARGTPVPRVRTGSGGASNGGTSASITIPLTVTVSLGGVSARVPDLRRYRAPPAADIGDDDANIAYDDEAVPADYRDREGYKSDFLGTTFAVDLPTVERGSDDVLPFEFEGKTETELRYQHFSVVMNRRRRLCFFSAANIDGGLSKKTKRVAWKWDPRLPKELQIMKECYGGPPKFSRGHMTRREDPAWGDVRAAKRGNEDSMHVTNATPQMQAFNSPIWLALEDYALEHAREDDMKISVFTGPYFSNNDPEMFGVSIPLAFWKIIAFIHDDTGKLCATGYEMTQEQSLQPAEEFVFGAFTSPQLNVATQVSIRSIEAKSGLGFGRLASVDPLAGDEESIAGDGARAPLETLEQIRFTR